jgi:methylthioribose-1-phosphate isomerase
MNLLMHGIPDEAFLSYLNQKAKNCSLNCYISEGRPFLGGIHTVAESLILTGCRTTIITDNMIACLMRERLFDCAFIFYREISNAFLTAHIGSLIVVICAKYFSIPVYYHKGNSSVKMEYGNRKDLLLFDGVQIAPTDICTFVPLWEKVPLSDLQSDYELMFASI